MSIKFFIIFFAIVFSLLVDYLFVTFSAFSSGCGVPPRSHLKGWSTHFPAAGNISCWWLTATSLMDPASTPGNCLTHGYALFQGAADDQWLPKVVIRRPGPQPELGTTLKGHLSSQKRWVRPQLQPLCESLSPSPSSVFLTTFHVFFQRALSSKPAAHNSPSQNLFPGNPSLLLIEMQ